VCVCVRERERERERYSVCNQVLCARKKEIACVLCASRDREIVREALIMNHLKEREKKKKEKKERGEIMTLFVLILFVIIFTIPLKRTPDQ